MSATRQGSTSPCKGEVGREAAGIEIDGGQHAEKAAQQKDTQRTAYLAAKNIVVIRFWNNEVLGNLEGVVTEIDRVSRERSAPAKTPSPTLPLAGGGSTGAAP